MAQFDPEAPEGLCGNFLGHCWFLQILGLTSSPSTTFSKSMRTSWSLLIVFAKRSHQIAESSFLFPFLFVLLFLGSAKENR
jgi:hypothetical protein